MRRSVSVEVGRGLRSGQGLAIWMPHSAARVTLVLLQLSSLKICMGEVVAQDGVVWEDVRVLIEGLALFLGCKTPRTGLLRKSPKHLFDYLRANRITKIVRLLIDLRSSYPRIGVAKFPPSAPEPSLDKPEHMSPYCIHARKNM